MSVSPQALAASPLYDDSPSHYPTRTVVIIKNHALDHRFDIERRIVEASFEIAKERQMEFDVESDPDTLYELFGDDADSLVEGPVWVYVLERRRAVEVWLTLMGDSDPAVAREESPNSLRALYGISREQNSLAGSPDTQTAEIQIASLFASSPPFPSTDLPDDAISLSGEGTYDIVPSASITSSIRRTTSDGSDLYSGTNTSSQGRLANGKPLFRARPLPPTHVVPDIQPRTTRAAALRAGVPVDKSPSRPRAPPSKEALAKTFANVPGHKRTGTISVASTAPPVIAPRMTRAASLRLGQKPPPTPAHRRQSTSSAPLEQTNTFEGVPGHKRRESLFVASTQAPVVAPRTNRSAALRAQKDAAPPTSFMFRTPTAPKVPGLSRSNSQLSLNSSTKNTPVRSASQASTHTTRPIPSRAASHNSQIAMGPASLGRTSKPAPTPASTTSKPRPSSAQAAPPSITPRTNKSALLRAAKKVLNVGEGSKGPPSASAKGKTAPRVVMA